MKIGIYNWHGDFLCTETLKKLGYEHNQELEIAKEDFLKLVDTFFQHMNVQILKNQGIDNTEVSLGVTRHGWRFSQRG